MLIPVQSLVVIPSGEGLSFKDITGATSQTSYGKSGNINYADVEAIRLKIGSYTDIAGMATISFGSVFTRYREYIKTEGSMSLINGKYFTVGQTFVPQTALIAVPSGDTWQWTGNYVYPWINTWLPTASEVALSISVSEIGQSGTIVQDDIYTSVYEVYDDIQSGTTTSVDGQQYMVISGTATYDGDIFNAGEVFVGRDASNITTTGTYALLNATSTQYFVLTFNLIKSLLDLIESISVNPGYYPDVEEQIYIIRIQLEALSYSCWTGNVSFTYANELIQNLTAKTEYLIQNN